MLVQNANSSSLIIQSSRLVGKTEAYIAFSGPYASASNAMENGTCSNGTMEWLSSSSVPYTYNLAVAKITGFDDTQNIQITGNSTIGNFGMMTVVI